MTVLCEDVDQGIVQMTLCREPVNALNPEFLTDVEQRLTAIDENNRVKAVIITSGLSVFSAGMDLKEAQAFSSAQQAAVVNSLNQTFFRLFNMSKPVIAAANGAAIAGGLLVMIGAILLWTGVYSQLTNPRRVLSPNGNES